MVAPAADPPAVHPATEIFATRWPVATWLPAAVALIVFVVLFASPMGTLFHDWMTDDDANYGLLLFPVALWLAWRAGVRADARPNIAGGTAILFGAVVVRVLGSLAAEFFSQRFAIWLALVGLVVFSCGWRQVRHWWLPLILLFLSIPLPALIINYLAIPLQFRASRLGTAMIQWRHIPVRTHGNVIELPNAILFVAEACSGLRSLSALIALGVLIGGLYLRTGLARLGLILSVIPVAVFLNGVRIFLTAFLVYFVDPDLGQGAAHERQGMVMFVAAFAALGALAAVIKFIESGYFRWRAADA
ncbi:MAG TPA: exosortase/archaeosortase family protein [Gemmatimonadales bacterium]|jgi:exosortase